MAVFYLDLSVLKSTLYAFILVELRRFINSTKLIELILLANVNSEVEGLNQRGVEKCNNFGPFQGYISETVQDSR